MWTALRYAALASLLLLSAGGTYAQSAHENLARQLGLPVLPAEGVEVRVWLESNERVSSIFRIVKTRRRVEVERFAFAGVVRPEKNGDSVEEAERETTTNRALLGRERCSGKVMQSADYLWCRIALRSSGPWSVLFDDLLPDQLRDLPSPGRRSCE